MFVTIAICTRNRPDTLKESLENLLEVIKGKNAEVLVVDASDNQKTKNIIKRLKRTYKNNKLKYFYEKNQGITFSRNSALRESSSDTVSFIDDDVFVSKTWFKELAKALIKYPKAAIIGGKVLPQNPIPKKSWLSLLMKKKKNFWPYALLDYGDKPKLLKKTPVFSANFAVRKRYIQLIGGFCELFANQQSGLKVFGGEDPEFVLRAQNKGLQVVYWPKLRVFHKLFPHKFTKGYFRWRYYENGKENAFIHLIHFKGKVFKDVGYMIRDLPVHLKRVIGMYLLKRERNFHHELSLFYILGYFYGSIYFLLRYNKFRYKTTKQ